MSIFIKAGLWLEKKTGFKGEFNLTKYVEDLIASTPGGSQDLQSVLDNGTYAEVDGGNSYVDILGGNSLNSRYIDITVSNGMYDNTQVSSSVNIDNNRLIAVNVNGATEDVSRLIVENGIFEFHRQDIGSNKKTTIKAERPTEETTLLFPSKIATGTYTIATLDDIVDSRPYKVYTALVSQSGTNAPTAIVLENTLGGTVVWSRSNIGFYSATLTGAFKVNKTAILALPGATYNSNIAADRIGENFIQFVTRANNSSSPFDNYLNSATIEIRVYN